MAAFDTFRPLSGAALAGRRFSFANLLAAVAVWNDARMTRKALSRLTARELDDIGLSRADIDAVVANQFRR